MRGVAFCSVAICLGLAGTARGNDSPAAPLPTAKADTVDDDLAAKKGRQIRLDLKIGELSITEMRRLGIDFSEIRNGQKQQDRQGTASVVTMLTRNGALKLMADPTLITVDRRPASFHSGPTVAGRKIGTQVDLTATLLQRRRVGIKLHASQTDVDPSLSVPTSGGTAAGYRTREIDTEFEMDLGATMICGGPVQTAMQVVVDPKTGRKSSVQVETAMLFLVIPQLFVDLAQE